MKASAGAASRMDELVTVPDIRHWVRSRRREGRRIALVPTMGYLHEGHLRLVDEAHGRADVVVMTIFVNPLQFAPGEDLTRYPRDLARDRRLARERGVDALFVPSEGVMYPASPEIRIVPGSTAERWEGAARPGHFAGVLTVVAKLFHIVEPDVACFGRKDVQQSVLIRQMVRELDWPIELVVVPTVREEDGLALSSRNAYLDAEQRQRAVALSGALREAHLAWRGGERSAAQLEARIRRFLGAVPDIQVEYVAVAEPEALVPVTEVRGDTVVAIAARIGPTRLIDNIVLDEGVV
jgi:pantoate--beta-alanine ligase